MSPVWWYLNRAVAGLAVVAVTCIVAGTVVALVTRSFGSTYLYAYLAVVLGGSLGAIPAIAIMFFTRASTRPWRSAPVVFAGAIVGFLLLSLPIGALLQRFGDPLIGTLAAVILFPTLGGAIATRFLPRST
jgi:hypothetical protein